MVRLRSAAALALVTFAGCGAPSPPPAAPAPVARPPAPPPSEAAEPPSLPSVTIDGTRVTIVSPSGSEKIVDPGEVHAPPGDRALLGVGFTMLRVLDESTVLLGMGDGTLASVDLTGHRHWSLGFRGAIRGIELTADGLVVVTTQRGVTALVTPAGRLRWERQVTAERLGPAAFAPSGIILVASRRGVFALSPAGEVVFTHASPLLFQTCAERCEDEVPWVSFQGDQVLAGPSLRFRLDAPHPAVPSLAPTFPLTFRKVAEGSFSAVVATGPTEVAALVGYAIDSYNNWPYHPKQEVVRTDGHRTTRVPLPDTTPRAVDFAGRGRPQRAPIVSDALVTGPDGSPWVLSRRLSGELTGGEDGYTAPWVGVCEVFEIAGGRARERTDLSGAFDQNLGVGTELGRIAAAPQGRADLLCFGSRPTCALYDGPGFRLLAPPGRVASAARIGDVDWIVNDAGELHRRDGAAFRRVPLPDKLQVKRVSGTGERDVWADVEQRYFLLHFDGASWTEVPVPVESTGGVFGRAADDAWSASGQARWDGKSWSLVYDAPAAASVLARDRDDVWLAGAGLWHGTAPGPTPVRLAPPEPPDDGAIPPPPPLPLDAPEAGYTVERATFAVAGGAPLDAALDASAEPDGTLRLRAWDRTVELDAGGRATQPRRAAARGRPPPWTVRASDELSPHAVVLADDGAARPVLGLPSASWSAVAQAPDGGAWFAGGLSPGPSGEGILFHARGRLGAGGTSRARVPASLLAVVAIGADEAWAVGAGGAVVRVQGAVVTRHTLPSGEWLRAVAARGPDDVWIGGDGGTLLHYDGRGFHAVSHPLGSNAAFTAIAWSPAALWAVGPSGILRIAKRH